METIKKMNIVVQLIQPVLIEVEKDKSESWSRLIFIEASRFYEGDKLLRITTKRNKVWMFPYTNIKSIEYKEVDKQASKY